MPFLSIVTGTFNEADNVAELHERISRVISEQLARYDFEIIFIDNASTDKTVDKLKGIARLDPRVKIIVNNRNFGAVRSGYHGLLQAKGDAIVCMASDLQDPPELIPQFVKRWEEGYKIVLAQKTNSDESPVFFLVRKTYYNLVNWLADIELVKNVTGFGLYDRCVVEDVRRINDPYPYLRGLVCDLGYSRALISFTQPTRKRGITSNNFYSLWDMAMLGITNHSKVPLRLATFVGLGVATCSFFVAMVYLVYKLLYWNNFNAGQAPLVIGMFFIGAIQLAFIGLLGEYIGAIHTHVLHRPPVIERERINFD
jgi:glycosyltransferase involved in cell wall biosynthesis